MYLIAGPCQIEDRDMMIRTAETLVKEADIYNQDLIFKSSFDKANRTSVDGVRGAGLEEGLRILEEIRETFGVSILTDVHETCQVNEVADVADIIQIPAFLCRQTDLIQAVSNSHCIINVKKGQFLAPWDVGGILSKTGTEDVWITERGSSFGYNTLVVDFTGIQYMRSNFDVPIIFDATHSVQKPGGMGASSGGNRQYVRGLVRAVCAQGIDGIFVEIHPDPENAPSDGPNSLHLKDFTEILATIRVYGDNHY
jgi:2-dehydro-3-deoxyphosphooctonate aldolase (KDO 8-P synthase)